MTRILYSPPPGDTKVVKRMNLFFFFGTFGGNVDEPPRLHLSAHHTSKFNLDFVQSLSLTDATVRRARAFLSLEGSTQNHQQVRIYVHICDALGRKEEATKHHRKNSLSSCRPGAYICMCTFIRDYNVRELGILLTRIERERESHLILSLFSTRETLAIARAEWYHIHYIRLSKLDF